MFAILLLECLETVIAIQIVFIISDYIPNIAIVMNYRWIILQEYIFLYVCTCIKYICMHIWMCMYGWTCLYIESWCWLLESLPLSTLFIEIKTLNWIQTHWWLLSHLALVISSLHLQNAEIAGSVPCLTGN